MATPSLSRFLRLPLEIREMIYKFCCADSETYSSFDSETDSSFDSETDSSFDSETDSSFDSAEEEPTATSSRGFEIACSQPKLHFGLSGVNRQIRNEYFPIFAARHTFNISNPLKFANDYLSCMPPYRLSQLRHIALSWTRDDKVSISSEMRDLTRALETYPELVSNLQSIVFRMWWREEGYIKYGNPWYKLIRSVVQLLAALDGILKRQSLPRRHFLVAPCRYYSDFHVTIFAVSQATWDSVNDNQVAIGNCSNCKESRRGKFMKPATKKTLATSPNAFYLLNSESEWKDGLAIVRHTGTAQSSCGVVDEVVRRIAGGEPNWKAIFHSDDDQRVWDHGMRLLAE